jgi:hypothetical protein
LTPFYCDRDEYRTGTDRELSGYFSALFAVHAGDAFDRHAKKNIGSLFVSFQK